MTQSYIQEGKEWVVDMAEQEHPAVAGKFTGGKVGHDLAGTEVLKEQRLVGTVCRRRVLEMGLYSQPIRRPSRPSVQSSMIFPG